MTTTIYTAYHKPSPLVQSGSITPIHVGRALAEAPLPHMIGDDTGENISTGNRAWCELTALYWAWKNGPREGMIGLMHYRRLLDLTGSAPDGPVEAKPDHIHLPDWCASAEDWLAHESDNWDIVLPRMHRMGRSVENNYRAGHQGQDWDLLRDIITRDHPDYLDSFETIAKGHQIRLGNIALMRHELLDAYCTWLFDILFKVEAAPLDRTHYSPTHARYLGFLSERLLTVFVHHLQKTRPDLRLREVAILNLADTVTTPYLTPEASPNGDSVNIAMAVDRAYLPHAAAMLRSLLDHAAPERPLNIFFLYSGIGAQGLHMLESVVRTRPNTHLHAINTGGFFARSYRSSSRAPSNATYNRFLLFKLLPGLKRLLYLDADVIVKRDVCALYDSDLGEAMIGAVPDWIMTRTLTGPTPTIDPDVPDLAAYHRDRLQLSDAQIARYFNAGVLLLNFEKMGDLAALSDQMMREIDEGRYLFRDQDILNKTFRNDLALLDPRWNVFNSLPGAYARVPATGYATAMEARQDPWLIHYADRDYKPWHGHAVPHAEDYWQALIRTPFYGEVLSSLAGRASRRNSPAPVEAPSKAPMVKMGRDLAERVPVLKTPLLKIYAGWRSWRGGAAG
jgi:lipopolysaccharide biosynthesis glycosyltransferase